MPLITVKLLAAEPVLEELVSPAGQVDFQQAFPLPAVDTYPQERCPTHYGIYSDTLAAWEEDYTVDLEDAADELAALCVSYRNHRAGRLASSASVAECHWGTPAPETATPQNPAQGSIAFQADRIPHPLLTKLSNAHPRTPIVLLAGNAQDHWVSKATYEGGRTLEPVSWSPTDGDAYRRAYADLFGSEAIADLQLPNS